MLPEAQPEGIAPSRGTARRFARVTVLVRGTNSADERFRERTRTIMIYAQGGLLYLNESVETDATLVLYNPETEEEQDCRVNYLGDVTKHGQRVGVEFNSPAPHFWGIDFSLTAPPQRVTATGQSH
jgi:hypothetical protein